MRYLQRGEAAAAGAAGERQRQVSSPTSQARRWPAHVTSRGGSSSGCHGGKGATAAAATTHNRASRVCHARVDVKRWHTTAADADVTCSLFCSRTTVLITPPMA